MRNRRAADLAQVLAAGGFDQPVEGVVGVLGARLDALVAEVDGLLRVVADVGDVAGRIVGVVQVLRPGQSGPCRRRQAGEQSPGRHTASRRVSSCARRIGELGRRCRSSVSAVAIVDQGALALGVVVDVGDRVQVRGGRIEPARGLGIPVEPGVHLLQQVGLVVDSAG